MKTEVMLDGDRYRLTIPTISMHKRLQRLLEQRNDLFLDETKESFPLVSVIGPTVSCPFFSYGEQAPKTGYMVVQAENDGVPFVTEASKEMHPIRPMLVPLTKEGKPDPDAIRDPDGTFVTGGTMYNADKCPLDMAIFGLLTLTCGSWIGDTYDLSAPQKILPWVVVGGMLVSRYAMFIANGKTLVESGLLPVDLQVL